MIYIMKQEGLYEWHDQLQPRLHLKLFILVVYFAFFFLSLFVYLFQGLHKAGGKYGYEHAAQRLLGSFWWTGIIYDWLMVALRTIDQS